jgi:hypothetical protein
MKENRTFHCVLTWNIKHGGEYIIATCLDKEDADRVAAALEYSTVEEWEVDKLLEHLRGVMDRRENKDRRRAGYE